MIKRTYYFHFSRYEDVEGESVRAGSSWRLIQRRGFRKPNLVEISEETIKSLQESFPGQSIFLDRIERVD